MGDAVRLGGLSLQQRVPNTCSTTSGSSCVFPFTYGGVQHHQCTYADSPLPWCATATQADGSVITNSWGDCDVSSSSSSCQAESLGLSSCSTPAGDCVFPFRHNGVVYQSCTTVDTGVSWCSTAVTSQGDHVAGSEGTCPASCDSTSTSTTSTTTAPTTSSTTSSTSSSCTPGQLSTVECSTCVCNSLGQQVCTTDTCSSSTTSTTSSSTQQLFDGIRPGHRESLRVSLHVQQRDLRHLCRVGVRGHQPGPDLVQHQGGQLGCSRQWRG